MAVHLTCSLNWGVGGLSRVSTFNPERAPTFVYMAVSVRASESSQHIYIAESLALSSCSSRPLSSSGMVVNPRGLTTMTIDFFSTDIPELDRGREEQDHSASDSAM